MWHFCDFFHRALLSSCVAVLAAAFVGPGGRACGAEAMGLVKGIVVDEAGQPVAGARVVAARLSFYELGDPFAPALDAATDAKGRFQAQLAPGDYRIWAAKGVLTALDVATNVEGRFRTQLAGDYWVWVAKGFLTWEGSRTRFPFWTVEASRPLDVRITLRKGRRVEGIVVRKEDGQPVASAKVLHDTGLPAMTDREGRFTVEGAGEEEGEVMVSAPGLADTHVEEQQLDAWPRPSLRIEMPPGLTVRGRVTDEAGRSIRAARVTTSHTLWASSSCLTDAAGNYALAGLPQDREGVSIVAYHRDYATAEAEGPDLKLGQGIAAEGQVRGPDGKPIPDALVGCWFPRQDPHGNGRTDAKGFFRLDHLSSDSGQSLAVRAKGYVHETKSVEPGQGAAVPHLSFDLKKGLQAVGRVTDPQGKPLAGAGLVALTGEPGG